MRSTLLDQAGQADDERKNGESETSVCIWVDFSTGKKITTTEIPREVQPATQAAADKTRDEHIQVLNEFLRNLSEAGLDLDYQTARTIIALAVCSEYRWTPEATGKALEIAKQCRTPEARGSFTEVFLSRMDKTEDVCHAQMRRLMDMQKLQTRLPRNDGDREQTLRVMDFVLCMLLTAQRILKSGPRIANP